jgi:hypothetical protein
MLAKASAGTETNRQVAKKNANSAGWSGLNIKNSF